MAVGDDRVTFWFGCDMLRHAEMIRLSIMLLERVGCDASAVGGPGYCCGTVHDHEPRAASTMAGRTVERFNEGAARDGRDKVITWCPLVPHAHVRRHGARQRHAFRHRPFERGPVGPRRTARAHHERSREPAGSPASARGLRHPRRHRTAALSTCCARISGVELIEGPAHPGHMCSALAAVPGALAAAAEATWSAAAANGCDTVCTIFHSCHRELAALDGKDKIRVRNWVHLVAESMGIDASDAYRDWRWARRQISRRSNGPRKRDIASSSEPELRRPPPLR